jgi:hypothetical protein
MMHGTMGKKEREENKKKKERKKERKAKSKRKKERKKKLTFYAQTPHSVLTLCKM